MYFFDILISKNYPTLRYFVHFDLEITHYNGVHFFGILFSKSGLKMVCFVNFNLEMYFTPQRHIFFRHFNF